MEIIFQTLIPAFAGIFLVAVLYLWKKLQQSRRQLVQAEQELDSLSNLQITHSHLISRFDETQTLVNSQSEKLQEFYVLQGQFDEIHAQLKKYEADILASTQEKNELQRKLTETKQLTAELQERLTQESRQSQEKITLLENAKQQLTQEFKLLANQVFDEKQKQFTQNSKDSLESLLKPMNQSLEQFRSRLETTHKEDIEGRASLKEQLKQLQTLNSQMSIETQNLTQALKGESKMQGNWGELILQRLLERSGLREGQEFDREKSFTSEEGKRLRPDVILNLPDNKHIVIDSKVSLTDYERALNAPSDEARLKATKAHLQSLKSHISTLAAKRYEHLNQLNAPDFVLMFVPIEAAYLMAIEENSHIFEDAFDQRVAVVTPTTLFTTLKTIEQLWRYERQSENTVKLIQRAADVHDKFVGFVANFEKVGTQITQANNAYNDAFKQLSTGRGNLVRQAQMLKELAGKTKKELPEHLVSEQELDKKSSKNALEDASEIG
ncbi:DNA recombination protein RmuC [Thiomicrorhabdus indica]|uniref:DNA recombination protein RmuC n=1 Tax=Thiomicrorhabdus indica TaxID=2267253 RepID=UPI00102E0C2F|nr:DNA recombination protein RmuC [Thiomicrorhabdus indica]